MAVKRTFLWELVSNELQSPSYLFGTMHVQDLRAFTRLGDIRDKIDSCDAFAVEFHLDQAYGMAIGAGMIIPKGKKLSELIPEKRYHKLRRIIEKATGLDIHQFQRTLPLILTGLIASQILRKDMPESLDENLWHYARLKGKTLIGIETSAEQLAIMKRISLDQQLKMLLDLGKNISRFRRHTLQTTELYQKGDHLQLLQTVRRNAGGLRHIMLHERNKLMAARIFQHASRQSIFVAIGAGHLAGGKGVIRYLKSMGISVEPVV